jgi:type VI secretion system protein ImpF
MARIDKSKELRPSLLDRLIDHEPHTQVASEIGATQRVRELRMSVKRDLESLLNTRFRLVEPPDDMPELAHSLLNYGMPDLATINVTSVDKRTEFVRTLERIIRSYEPRFKSVKIIPRENKETKDRTLRFRIEATLYADPAPEVVIFDSELDPVSRVVNVEESRNG